jgi:hypothetical protein
MIIISDFLGYGDSLMNNITAIAEKFDILAMMVNDPADIRMSKTGPIVEAMDPYGEEVRYIESAKLAKAYEQANRERISKHAHFLAISGTQMCVFEKTDNVERKVTHLLAKRNFLGGFN